METELSNNAEQPQRLQARLGVLLSHLFLLLPPTDSSDGSQSTHLASRNGANSLSKSNQVATYRLGFRTMTAK